MIEAYEIRLGNWIHLGKTDIQVFNITYNRTLGHCINHPNIPISDFEPIPLSEEWLMRFNCNKTESFECAMVCQGVEFFFDKKHDRILISGGNRRRFINYVHQFQNIIFALTGEELPTTQSAPQE